MDGLEQAENLYGGRDDKIKKAQPIRASVDDEDGKAVEINLRISYREGSTPTLKELRRMLSNVLTAMTKQLTEIFKLKQ